MRRLDHFNFLMDPFSLHPFFFPARNRLASILLLLPPLLPAENSVNITERSALAACVGSLPPALLDFIFEPMPPAKNLSILD